MTRSEVLHTCTVTHGKTYIRTEDTQFTPKFRFLIKMDIVSGELFWYHVIALDWSFSTTARTLAVSI